MLKLAEERAGVPSPDLLMEMCQIKGLKKIYLHIKF
jgi:hypothetical protein